MVLVAKRAIAVYYSWLISPDMHPLTNHGEHHYHHDPPSPKSAMTEPQEGVLLPLLLALHMWFIFITV